MATIYYIVCPYISDCFSWETFPCEGYSPLLICPLLWWLSPLNPSLAVTKVFHSSRVRFLWIGNSCLVELNYAGPWNVKYRWFLGASGSFSLLGALLFISREHVAVITRACLLGNSFLCFLSWANLHLIVLLLQPLLFVDPLRELIF